MSEATERSQPFAGPSAVSTMPLEVVVDGTTVAAGAVTLRTYGHEPDRLSTRRFIASVRAGVLELAHRLAVSYGIDSDHLEETMSALEYTHDDIDIMFGFHTAAGRTDVGERHEYLRYLCRELGHALVDQLPEGDEKKQAIRALRLVMMHGNSAIAIGFREPPAPPPIPRPVPRPPASGPASAYQASRPGVYRGRENGSAPVHTTRTPPPPAVPKPRAAGDEKTNT